MADRRAWTIGIFAYIAILGALLQLRGALLPSIGEHFAVTEGQLGLIASAGSVGALVALVSVGMAANRLDVRRTMLAGIVGLVSTLVVIGSAPVYPVLLGGFFLAGLAQGCLNGLDRPLLSSLYPSRRGHIFNRQDMVWAIGATLGPVIATVALVVAGWRVAFYAFALALVPIAIGFWRLDGPALAGERTLPLGELGGLLGRPTIAATGGLMLLLSLVESGMFTWLPYYVDQSLPRSVANLSLSVYLAAYVPGRYAFGIATERYDNLSLVFASAALASLSLGAFVVLDGFAMLPAIFLVGFLVAGIFPTLLAWAMNAVPEYSGPVNALAFGASATGFVLFPATMGFVAERYSLGLAMWLVVVASLLFTVVVGVVAFVGVHRRGGSIRLRPE